MYLAAWIDSESFTDLHYRYSDSIESGVDWFKESIADEGVFKVRDNRADYVDEDWFQVCEVYELDDKPYILVWWHGYDGVDFTVRTFNTADEAHDVVKSEIDYLVSMLEDADVYAAYKNVIRIGDPYVVDTGVEWEMWQIIKREV